MFKVFTALFLLAASVAALPNRPVITKPPQPLPTRSWVESPVTTRDVEPGTLTLHVPRSVPAPSGFDMYVIPFLLCYTSLTYTLQYKHVCA